MKHVPEHEQLRGRDDGHLAALTPCLTKLGIIDESADCQRTTVLPSRKDSRARRLPASTRPLRPERETHPVLSQWKKE